jgi:hypothetical protein
LTPRLKALTALRLFLYSNNENDITDSVLQQLNSTAPVEAVKNEDKDVKKKDSKK